jgi:hypothetical protein
MALRVGLLLAVSCLLCVFSRDAFARNKTDLVFLTNGDRFTGEITQMDQGLLTLKTDAVGTLNIEWEDVDSLISVYGFRVEDEEGTKYFGRIVMGRDDTLHVISHARIDPVFQTAVVVITPLEATFWEQLDGSITAGVSYTKSNSLFQTNASLDVRRQTTLRLLELDANSIVTSEEDGDAQRRQGLTLAYSRLFRGRWFAIGSTSLESNDELGLDLRLSLAPGLGLNMVRTNRHKLVSTAGLTVNREWTEGDDSYNLESFLSLSYASFRYDHPKIDVTSDAYVYPSLTNWGRVRLELDVDINREIVKDFTINLSLYDSYDNEPPDPTAAKNDYGLVAGMGWSF